MQAGQVGSQPAIAEAMCTTFKLIGDNLQLGKFLGLCVILSGSLHVFAVETPKQTMERKCKFSGTKRVPRLCWANITLLLGQAGRQAGGSAEETTDLLTMRKISQEEPVKWWEEEDEEEERKRAETQSSRTREI